MPAIFWITCLRISITRIPKQADYLLEDVAKTYERVLALFTVKPMMNNTSMPQGKIQPPFSAVEAALWGTSFGIVSVIIIVTNCLAITAFVKTKPHRKHTHYFLVNLSVADLLVGSISVPLFISYLANPDLWKGSRAFPIVHSTVDILSGLASIFTLAVVSLERLYAVSIPFKFRRIPKRAYFLCIASVWLLASCVAAIGIAFYYGKVRESFYAAVIISLTLSLIVTCVAYASIIFKINQKNNNAKQTNDSVVERRLSITLLCITAIFIFSWLPFELIFILVHLCKTCQFTMNPVFFIKLLHYSNSFMNAVVYTFRIPEFKDALIEIFQSHGTLGEGQLPLQDMTGDSITLVTRVNQRTLMFESDEVLVREATVNIDDNLS